MNYRAVMVIQNAQQPVYRNPQTRRAPTIIMARRISTILGMRKIHRMGIILKMETILRMETMSRRRGIDRKITMSHRMAITTLKTTTSPRMATTPGAIIPRKTVMIIRITTIRTKITSPGRLLRTGKRL